MTGDGSELTLAERRDALAGARRALAGLDSRLWESGGSQLGELLREVDESLADRLDAIEYASSAVVQLGWRRDQVPHPLDGFGFVVPAKEPGRLLAGSFSSVKYAGRAPRYHVLMRAFLGGATDPEAMDLDDKEMTDIARTQFRKLLGVTAPPQLSRVTRWERSMPQYKVGHVERVAEIDRLVGEHAGLHLAGNAYRGVGIPDCIADAEQTIDAILSESL